MAVAAQKNVPDVQTALQPFFSRHDSFPPRNGWLKKGFDAIIDEPGIFNREDIGVILGVGKNMVKAIKYWCLAFKLSEEVFDKSAKTKVLVLSEFGKQLLSENGWDPYLEDMGSYWLLHWKLLKSPCTATSWHFAFNHFRHAEFTQSDFLNELNDFAEITFPDNKFSTATFENDVSCLTRMYSKDNSGKSILEESIASPFADLNLITRIADGKHFAFHVSAKPNLPSRIVAAAVMDYIESVGSTERSINISNLVYGAGSPGLVFKLPESAIYGALEEVAEERKDLSLSQTAGMVQLQFHKDPGQIKNQILAQYYAADRR